MPFWDGIAAALGGRTANLERDLRDRIVEDSLGGATALRTVLLCESPHRDEISHGHPLAGASGKAVTQALARNLNDFKGRKEPIGCLLHRDPQCVNAGEQLPSPVNGAVPSSLGLMNVSRLPLDSEAYCLDARREYSELLCYFEAVKSKLEKKKSGQGVQFLRNLDVTHAPSQVYAVLRADLIRRLNQLDQISQDVMVVPCGRVAEAFFDWATGECGYQSGTEPYGCFVHHPSRNRWQWDDNRAAIDRLVNTIYERAT